MAENFKVDARWNYSGNMKVGSNIATLSTLASDRFFETEYGLVQGTCSGCCEGCGRAKEGKKRPPCYVFKSYRRKSVINGHARNTLSIRKDPDLAFRQLSDSLSRKRIPVLAARYDQSGEIENGMVFRYMCRTAAEHADIPFYIYTKKYNIVVPALLERKVPKNLVVIFSIWHEQGVNEFLTVGFLPNVKAFVYCDKNSDPVNGWGEEEYAKVCIFIQTWCKAYDLKGKMNHAVTCDKCTKCFNHRNCHQIIATWDH